MTWAPTETQKSIYKLFSLDPTLMGLLGIVTEKQKITFSSTPVTGSFKFRFKGVDSVAIPALDVNAGHMQATLRLIEGLENVVVTSISSVIYDISFDGVPGALPNISVVDNTLQNVVPENVTTVITKVNRGVQKVFDEVPDNIEYPYITLQILPWTDRGSHTLEGLACDLQINTWYREPGRGNLQVQIIQNRIDELLHKNDICIDGWNVVGLRRSFIDIVRDTDNITKQGIQRFNLLTGEA